VSPRSSAPASIWRMIFDMLVVDAFALRTIYFLNFLDDQR
jgi:hypothetical protein